MSDSIQIIIHDKISRFPAAYAVVLLSFGIVYEVCFSQSIEPWSSIAVLPALALLVTALGRDGKTILLIAAALFFFLIGRYLAHEQMVSGADFNPSSDKSVVRASILNLWSSDDQSRVFLLEDGWDITSNSQLPGLGRLTLRGNKSELSAGDRIAFRTRLRKPTNRGNPGEYDWETDCKQNGIIWLASASGPDCVAVINRGFAWTPNAIVFRARRAMARFLDDHSGKIVGRYCERFANSAAPNQVRGFLKGIVIGDMGGIDYALQQNFSDSGLAHVLSASGLHVGIVVILCLFALRVTVYIMPGILLWIPLKKLGALISIPAVIFYCALVGARVPAVRSGIMGVVIALALLLGRRWNSGNSLALAALIILLMNPLSMFTPSFQLSFGAVAGIFVVVPSFVRNMKLKDPTQASSDPDSRFGSNRFVFYFLLVTITSIAATLPITPFLLQTFHSLPVWTIPANLITDFALTPALAFGLLGPIVGFISPAVGSWILALADLISWFIIEVASFFSSLPASVIRIPNMYPSEFLLCLAISLLLMWFVRTPRKNRLWMPAAASIGVLFLVGSLTFRHGNKEFRAVFLNVGKGDAAFVNAPGSRGMLIDGGAMTPYFDAGKSIVLPFFSWAGVKSLDGVLISHPDMDHIGGILSVLGRVSVSEIFWNPTDSRPPHIKAIFDRVNSERIISVNRTLKTLKFGDAGITFLNDAYSSANHSRSTNNASVIAKIDYGKVSFLFTGDLERDGEQLLLDSGLSLTATVLKVGHHGGSTSTSMKFLNAVRPEIAVISADFQPAANTPASGVLDRLQSVGTQVFITGKDGAITIETDGDDLYVTTGRSHGYGSGLVRKEFKRQ